MSCPLSVCEGGHMGGPLIGLALSLLIGTPSPAMAEGEVATTDIGEVCARDAGGHFTYSRTHRGVPELPPVRGYERDHLVPLCLGGADNADNLQYQLWPEARRKDQIEAAICRAVCGGKMSLQSGQRFFTEGKWR